MEVLCKLHVEGSEGGKQGEMGLAMEIGEAVGNLACQARTFHLSWIGNKTFLNCFEHVSSMVRL